MGEMILKTALDIGSSKVKVVLGELSGDGERIKVLGSEEVESQGVRKSKVENVEILSESIKEAVSLLEKQTKKTIKKTSLGIGGDHLKSITKNMKFEFNGEPTEIKEEHFKELYDLAENRVSPTESIIKKELYNIRVDNSGILKNPVGMVGNSLEGDVHLITADKSQLELLIEAVNKAGLEVEEITLNSYASAQSILTQEDRKMGVALVDIGEGSTDIIIFKNEKLIYSKSIPIGGMHYLNDLAYMFKLEKEEALKLKNEYTKKRLEENVEITVGEEIKKISTASVRDLLDARSGDIVNYLSKALEESGFKGYLGNGVILTGGATGMDELVEVLAKNLNYKVKVGTPIKLRGMYDTTPAYSTVLGILLEVLEKEHFKMKNIVNKVEETIEESKLPVNEEKTEDKKPKTEVTKKRAKSDKNESGKSYFDSMKSWIKEFI